MASLENGEDNANDQPTETTALLSRASSNGRRYQRLPFIEPTVSRIRAMKPGELASAEINLDPSLTPSARTAYALIILLELRCRVQRNTSRSSEVQQQWAAEQARAREAEELDRRIIQAYNDALDRGFGNEELLNMLWLAFPYAHGSDRTIRVIDLLSRKEAPTQLLTHPVVLLVLSNAWSLGLPSAMHGESDTFGERVFCRFSCICPPRFMHLLDFAFELVYLAVLANFLLEPPSRPIITYGPSPLGARSIFLLIYSASSLLRSWSLSVLPAGIVFLSLLFCLPAAPYPGDNAFDALLFALSLEVLSLHLPHPPSPALLFNVERSLPLSTLFHSSVRRVFIPALVFFLPTLLIAAYLLSSSLAGTFLQVQEFVSPVAPMETRAAFLALGVIVLLLFTSFIVLLTLLFPSLASSVPASHAPWDRYSEPVGLEARRMFVHSVAIYGRPYFFPPLLNLVPFALVRVPKMFLYVVGKRQVAFLDQVEAILWWTVVSPLCFIVASLRLWGIFQ